METIGDVKYSVLEPATFMRLNPGWVLLAGELPEIDAEYQVSLLRMESGIPLLPDIRGRFLRAMNVGRDTNTGDSAGDRSVGDPQGDEFLAHSHSYSFNWFKTFGWDRLLGGEGAVPVYTQEYSQEPQVETRGGRETRPRNICLYVYIKIN